MRRGTERPFVSVVMPVYREPAHVVQTALQSVLDQTWPVCEIILVNDSGAARPDLAALAPLGNNIRVIDHRGNRGGAVARNTGIEAARGTLIAFIDADDLWYPAKLETQLSGAVDAERCFFASNCLLVWKGRKALSNPLPPAPGRPLSAFLLRQGGALQTSTLIVPTQWAKKIGFRAGLKRHQDWDFVLRLEQAGLPLVYHHEALSDYVLSDNPDRVSLQKRGYLATVAWFKLTKDHVPVADQQYYFFRHCASRASLRTPLSLAAATLEVIALSPANGLKEAVGALRREIGRARRHKPVDEAAS